MTDYDKTRETYKPNHIKVLMIAESQPPAAGVPSSRQFYRTDSIYREDRLFTNTIRVLYPAAAELPEAELKQHKKMWLERFQADGWFMIEALETSLAHEVTKQERQALIRVHLPTLLARVKKLVRPGANIILIKSNVFDVAAEPLRAAGYKVLNHELLDYPGRFNQKSYREKLAAIIKTTV
jgi:hypothetical protein